MKHETIGITEDEESFLRHTLGADPRYFKKQWGFRNYYNSSRLTPIIKGLIEKGLVVKSVNSDTYFFATKKRRTGDRF